MKKIRLCLLAVVFAMFFSSCSQENELVAGRVITYNDGTICADIQFVYPDSKTDDFFTTEVKRIQTIKGETLLDAVLTEYTNIIAENYLTKNVASPITVKEVEDNHDTVLVILGEPPDSMTDGERLLIRDTLAMTLVNIPAVEEAGVYFGTKELDAKGNPIVLKKGTTVSKEEMYSQRQALIKLYYPDAQGRDLMVENRTVTLSKNDKIIEVAMKELLSGPTMEGIKSPFNSNLELVSAVVDSGVCFVDFSALPVTASGSVYEMYLKLYSIVNTAAEASGVDKVQIMVGGKVPEEYSSFTTDKYFVKDLSLLE